MRIPFLAALCSLVLASTAFSDTLYVDANAAGPTHDGSSWCAAYPLLQDALAAAAASGGAVNEIRVADGIYKPDQGTARTPGDREATFILRNGVTIAGGYAGCGAADPNERDIALFETILSGDLAGDDVEVPVADLLTEPTRAENCYHVVTSSGLNATATLDGCSITGGNASQIFLPHGYGAGMYNIGGNPTITGCTFRANSANQGGGMYNYNSSPTVNYCSFIGNIAIGSSLGSHGGGMYNDLSTPSTTNCSFNGNVSENGGGMYNHESHPTVTECTFIANAAEYIFWGHGGGMSNYRSYPTVTNCTFAANTAKENGGGVYNSRGGPTVTDCTFNGNSANDDGGGMYNRNSNSTVTNCTFSNNSAYYGGGGMYNSGNRPTIANCTFSRNSTTHDGGGMYNSGSGLTIANCTFIENSAADDGGGMYNSSGGPTVTDCTFNGNSANDLGGGMYNSRSNSTVTNCTFSNNSANEGGGGMYNGASDPTVANCTFSANSAYDAVGGYGNGGGMYNYNSSPTVANCILRGDVPSEIKDYNSTPMVSYSNIEGGFPGQSNTDSNPLFIRPPDPGLDGEWGTEDDDYGDLRLRVGSPSVDAGDPGFIAEPGATDLDGRPRVLCDRVDMGAFELAGDYDCNHRLDLRDVAGLQICFTGEENGPVISGCRTIDIDGDGDIDLRDVDAFVKMFSR